MVIGKETLENLVIMIDFLNKWITWSDISAEMKDPTLLDNRDNLFFLAMQLEPEQYQGILNQTMHILDAGGDGESKLEKLVNGYTHLDQIQKDKLLRLLKHCREFFNGKLKNWKIEVVSQMLNHIIVRHTRSHMVKKRSFKRKKDALLHLGISEQYSSSQ